MHACVVRALCVCVCVCVCVRVSVRVCVCIADMQSMQIRTVAIPFLSVPHNGGVCAGLYGYASACMCMHVYVRTNVYASVCMYL
jgi:hypothetical protein